MATNRSRRAAFTLVELMVVIGIIAVIFSLLMCGVQKARETAGRVNTMNNLYNLGMALNHHVTVKKAFPTEAGANNPSIYVTLLPYAEQQNATTTTPVKLYLSPTRRSVEVGAKRDFGYSASRAMGSAGPSVLDSPVGVQMDEINAGGKQTGNTALLSMVWISPLCYMGGDPTDTGWADKSNSRLNATGGIKHDSDSSANFNTFMGSPYEGGIPVLYVDGSVRMVPYTVNAQTWAQTWAYNVIRIRTCSSWEDTGGADVTRYNRTCKNCSTSCKCGCVAADQQYAFGGSSYSKEEVVELIVQNMQDGVLTDEEIYLLNKLSPKDYNKYVTLHQQWQERVVKKGDAGKPLDSDEAAYYKQYQIDKKNWEDYQAQQKAQQEAYAAQQKFQQDAINKGNAGLPLTDEEKKVYDQWLKDQAAAKAAAEAKAAADAAAAAQQKWNQDAITAGKNGTATAEQQAYYDQYQKDQKAAADQAAANQKAYEQQQATYKWQQDAIKKAQSGEALTYEEQQYYNSYQQQQQTYQQQQQAAQQAAQQDLQNRMTSYMNSQKTTTTTTGGTTSSGGSCSCPQPCCPAGQCTCAH